ncbi:MAG: glycoside hydrolase family 3 protein [Oligoflexales bacterium]|nr:glycoside hydrolase family 3 protein [Oligoflexales bacterium]
MNENVSPPNSDEAAAIVLLGAIESTEATEEESNFFQNEDISGIVLFKRNIPKTDKSLTDLQARRTIKNSLSQLKSSLLGPSSSAFKRSAPFLFAVDQEGGRVARLSRGVRNEGPALLLTNGAADAPSLRYIEQYGSDLAEGLRELGIQVNFAPVLDILTEPQNTSIGDRSFGYDKESVSSRAGAFLRGLQSGGVWGCLKHFPGQGHSMADTHLQASLVPIDPKTLWNRELVPFQALLSQVQMVMVSHCIYPTIDSKPAGLSSVFLGKILREELSYTGLIVSDDMNMKALDQDLSSWNNSLVEAITVGVDLLLICRDLQKIRAAIEALRMAARQSAAFEKRLLNAAHRVLRFRQNLVKKQGVES